MTRRVGSGKEKSGVRELTRMNANGEKAKKSGRGDERVRG